MKTIFKISTVAIIVVSIFTACQNDNALVSVPSNQTTSVVSNDVANPIMKATSVSSLTEYPGSPLFGRPNSTVYSFKVYDLSGKLSISVKLYERASGVTTYLPMTRSGVYWMLSKTLPINGWYDWRYVYSINNTNISSISYVLCNTYNTFNASGISSITWPFGADGSSWTNRTVYVNKSYQKWLGGGKVEGGAGNGPGEGLHVGYDERYSDDWNRGTGSDDLGAEIRSPLDGYIEIPNGSYISSLGTRSRFVSVIQQGSDGKLYRFYVAHLDQVNTNLYAGMYVRAGITRLGNLGMTGTTSPHAHCNMRDITNGKCLSIPFYFNAQ